MTHISHPKTTLDDYLEYCGMERYLQDNCERDLLSESGLRVEMAYLLKVRMGGKLFPEDVYLFDTAEGLTQFLRELSFSEGYISFIVSHEREHAEKAADLGYPYIYGCRLLRVDPASTIQPVDTNPEGMVAACFLSVYGLASYDDHRTIRRAATTRSLTDY